jgi:predicted alpha-1,2-mannosidase
VARDLARSLAADAEQCGAVPRWLLADRETGALGGDGGSHALATLDAFGITGYPRRAALRRMVRAAEDPGARCGRVRARPGLRSYLDLGFLPTDEAGIYGPTSTTLEYASTDFAVAMMARRLGHHRAAARLLARTGAWRRLFDPGPGLVRPRLRDGRASGGEETLGRADFVEGNARQYTWLVPHDLGGLIAALGGPAAADGRLDDLLGQLNAGLDAPHAFLGNEPSLLLPWIHNWTGRPWKTQADVRRALDQLYTEGPAGLPGNDDQGALSSWSAWAALGLYPAIPGLDGLTVASPAFPRVTVALPHRRRLLIEARGGGGYVHTVRLNGRRLRRAWIPWRSLRRGGVLRFRLGAGPSGWGARTPPP